MHMYLIFSIVLLTLTEPLRFSVSFAENASGSVEAEAAADNGNQQDLANKDENSTDHKKSLPFGYNPFQQQQPFYAQAGLQYPQLTQLPFQQQQQLCRVHEECPANFLCYNGACQMVTMQQGTKCATDAQCPSSNGSPTLCKTGVCYTISDFAVLYGSQQQQPFMPWYTGNYGTGNSMHCSNGGQPFLAQGTQYPTQCTVASQSLLGGMSSMFQQRQCPRGSTCDLMTNICCTQPSVFQNNPFQNNPFQNNPFQNPFSNMFPQRPWYPSGNPYQYNNFGSYQNMPYGSNSLYNNRFPDLGGFFPMDNNGFQQQNQLGSLAGAGTVCEQGEAYTGQTCSGTANNMATTTCPTGSYCRVASNACCRAVIGKK